MERKRRIIKNRCLALLVVPPLCGHLHANPNWALQPDCSLLSVERVVSDGYQQTPVSLHLDAERLSVITESNIDFETTATGLSVDGGTLIPADGLEKDTRLVFSENIQRIIEQFTAGNSVELRLNFWPTWPDTGQKTVAFSLLGFTRALHLKETCE